MKALIAAIVLFGSVSASAMVMGDKIHFQNNSTWVSSVYNKSLCLDGDLYEAVVSVCTKWSGNSDDRNCVRRAKKKIFQPMTSTRQRCAQYTGRDGNCSKWITVDYTQDRVKEVSFYDSNDNLLYTKTVTIPDCM